MSGQEAWEQVKDRAMALTPRPGRLPSWRFDAMRSLMEAELEPIRERLDELASTYNAENAATFTELVASSQRLALAGEWTLSRYERQDDSNRQVTEAAEAVTALRRPAMHALKLLVLLGLVPDSVAAPIRQGRGYRDLSGDLQALEPILQKHWAVLEPLQGSIAEPALRLTRESLDAMPGAAEALLTAYHQQRTADETDWHDVTRRLAGLLEDDWDQLRFMFAGALAALGQPTEVRPSLLALYRN